MRGESWLIDHEAGRTDEMTAVRGQEKWPPQFRFLDPILLEASFPLPGIEHKPEGATRCRISLPSALTSDIVRLVRSGLLVQRTNLLSPSVTLLPVFKVSQITATDAQCIQETQSWQRKSFKSLLSTGNPQDMCSGLIDLCALHFF
jgi:hypothetical protein